MQYEKFGTVLEKAKKKIEEARGGVLFIDEAYALNSGTENDFGQEAIDTILKAMEDHRDDLVVIVAGYTDLMDRFIHSNPGLESRFNRFLHFDDYTLDEMVQIFDMRCEKGCYRLTEDARPLLDKLDLLVDGPFIEAQKSIELRFRGSDNQRVLDVPASLAANTPVWCEKYR